MKICKYHFFFVPLRKNSKIMEKDDIISRVRDIVNKPASELTSEDKAFLQQAAEQVGVEPARRAGCKKCWHELAMQIWIKLKEEEQPEQDGRAFVLKDGVDLLFGGVRINAATLTDDLARYIIARGFPIKYFARCE